MREKRKGTIVYFKHSEKGSLIKLFVLMEDGSVMGGNRYILDDSPIQFNATDMFVRLSFVTNNFQKEFEFADMAKGDYEWQLTQGRKPEEMGKVTIFPNGHYEIEWKNKIEW